MFKSKLFVNNKILFYFITILMVIIITEILLQVICYTLEINMDKRYTYYYKNKEWGKIYFKEFQETKRKFVPFIQWQAAEYNGKYINIDSKGVRRTWKPKNLDGIKYKNIYFFGGSTMWGEGARDDYTIPSYFFKHLHKRGQKFFVFNYGENAFTFPQEIIYLMLLLRNGHRPSYVIFYDGANDVYAAYQSGEPGTIQNLAKIRKRLDSRSLPLVLGTVADVFKRRCMIYVTLNRMTTYLFSKPRFSEVGASYNDAQLKRLAAKTVKEYLISKNILDQLAKVYGFQYYCFWQPILYTEEKIIPGDGKGDPRLEDETLEKLYKYTNDMLKVRSFNNFFNISNVLENRTEVFYIDVAHITERGNEVVAERIYETIKGNLVMPSGPNE